MTEANFVELKINGNGISYAIKDKLQTEEGLSNMPSNSSVWQVVFDELGAETGETKSTYTHNGENKNVGEEWKNKGLNGNVEVHKGDVIKILQSTWDNIVSKVKAKIEELNAQSTDDNSADVDDSTEVTDDSTVKTKTQLAEENGYKTAGDKDGNWYYNEDDKSYYKWNGSDFEKKKGVTNVNKDGSYDTTGGPAKNGYTRKNRYNADGSLRWCAADKTDGTREENQTKAANALNLKAVQLGGKFVTKDIPANLTPNKKPVNNAHIYVGSKNCYYWDEKNHGFYNIDPKQIGLDPKELGLT